MSFAIMLIENSQEDMNRSILRCEDVAVRLPPNASATLGIETLCIRQGASSSRAMNFMRAKLMFLPMCCCNLATRLLSLLESLIFDFTELKSSQLFF